MKTTIYDGITADGMLRRSLSPVAEQVEREVLAYTAVMMHACADMPESELMEAAQIARRIDAGREFQA